MTTRLSPKVLDDYHKNGFLVLNDFIPPEKCLALKDRANELVANHVYTDDSSVFDTDEKTHIADEYFLDSSDNCSFFYEKKSDNGQVVNKIGHALHEQDATFSDFSRQSPIKHLVSTLGLSAPLLLQSMYIFKNARAGGEVTLHQDGSFLITTPDTLMGLWFAVDDATVNNGCLWVLRGGHRSPIHTYFVRTDKGMAFEKQYEPRWGESDLVPVEVKRGALVVIHSRLPHMSYANKSDTSRHAYVLHLISKHSEYSKKNWLQKKTALRGF